MRIFEWLILVLSILLGIQLFFRDKGRTGRLIGINLIALIVVSLGHFFFEGIRWQIVPLYMIVIGLTLIMNFSPKGRNYDLVSKILFVLLICINLVSIFLMPLPVLNEPSGDYLVGTKEYYLVDECREEIYGGNPNIMREIMIQIWYPTDNESEGDFAPWMPKMSFFTDEIGDRFGVPGFMLEHLKYVESHSIADGSLSAKSTTYPVILFSHGWAGFKEQNIYQVEELASHGYIVVGVNHTFGAMMTVFPDGRSFARDRSVLPDDVSDEAYFIASNKLVDQWAEDLEFVYQNLVEMNNTPSNMFYEKLSLEKVGVMGHSTGGGAAVEYCFENPRCGALLGMDPWLEPVSREKLESGHDEPMLLMFSEDWASVPEDEGNKPSVKELVTNSGAWISTMDISGTMHFDFSITPVISPLTEILGFKGPLDGDRILEIINAYTLDFFGEFIGSQTSVLLDGDNAKYPEVLFKNQ